MGFFDIFKKSNAVQRNEKTTADKDIHDEILEIVMKEVLFGFYSKEELFEEILDRMYDEEIDEEWLKEVIDDIYTKRKEEVVKWQKPTDFDKLVAVFDQLNGENIIAIHKAGYTEDDGWNDVNEVWEEVQKENISPIGYCFYHTQDLMRVIESGELVVAFGDICGEENKGVEIGNKIANMLQQEGFEISWEGTIGRRISIMNMCWQKLPDGESYGPDRAVKYLTQRFDKGKFYSSVVNSDSLRE